MNARDDLFVSHPKRVSPDGRDTAVRNLRALKPGYDGPAEWRASSGHYLTDDQVSGWLNLSPIPLLPELRIIRRANDDWQLHVNGTLVCGAADPAPVLADASRIAADYAESGVTPPMFTFDQQGV